MYALDTNVLVRYIVQDDKAQASKATKIIEGLNADKPAFVSCIVLCEVNWVLKSVYKSAKQDRVTVLQNLLSIPAFDIEHFDICVKALKAYQGGNADFSDYLIQNVGRAHGYDTLLTFDKNAHKSPGFKGL